MSIETIKLILKLALRFQRTDIDETEFKKRDLGFHKPNLVFFKLMNHNDGNVSTKNDCREDNMNVKTTLL